MLNIIIKMEENTDSKNTGRRGYQKWSGKFNHQPNGAFVASPLPNGTFERKAI